MLWGVDGAKSKSALSNFALVILFYKAKDIIVPMTNDTFDFSKVVVPADSLYRIQVISSLWSLATFTNHHE